MKSRKIAVKLHELFIGKRTFKERLPTALFPSLSLSFILFFFGPLDLSYNAKNFVEYTVLEILPSYLGLWGLSFIFLFLVSWLTGGKMHAFFCSLFTGLTIAFYIQGNWLNIDLGALDGQTILWQNYSNKAIFNFFVFSIIVSIPFLIHFFSRKVWKTAIIFISSLLIIMQFIPLSIKVFDDWKSNSLKSSHYIMSKDLEYEVGQENIIVFILDQTGPEEMNKTLERYPNVLEPFRDFQYFTNYGTVFTGTFPGGAYLLTHDFYDWTIQPEEWLKQAWNSDDAVNFYKQMAEHGWTSRLFNPARYVIGDLENAYDKFSNIEKIYGPQEFSIDRTAFRKLVKLSFYRYFPLIMKAPFWIYTAELNEMKQLTENEKPWNSADSMQKYLENGLKINKDKKVYTVYHYDGAHAPFEIKENGRRIRHEQPQEVGLQGQLAGYFYGISQYIQQMKDYHVYDNSTIIITTDHGNFYNTHSLFMIKPKNQRQTEMSYSNAPVSQSEFMETIAESAGLEKGQFGKSVFDFSDNEQRERCIYIRWLDSSFPVIPGKTQNVIREFCYVGDNDSLYNMIVNNEYNESYPLVPFY